MWSTGVLNWSWDEANYNIHSIQLLWHPHATTYFHRVRFQHTHVIHTRFMCKISVCNGSLVRWWERFHVYNDMVRVQISEPADCGAGGNITRAMYHLKYGHGDSYSLASVNKPLANICRHVTYIGIGLNANIPGPSDNDSAYLLKVQNITHIVDIALWCNRVYTASNIIIG